MALFDAFRYDGKRVLVVGGATGMGAAAAAAGAGRRRRGRGDGLRRGEAGGRQGHPRQPGRQGLHRRRGGRVRRAGARAVLLRRRGRRDARHREDQLRRSPPPHRPHAGRRHAAARARPSASSPRPPGLGWEANLGRAARSTWTRRTSTRRRRGPSSTAKADYFHSKQAVCAYVAREAFPCSSRASGSTPSAPGRPTPRWPRPTRRCGWGSAPTTARRPGSRPPRRSSRPTRWCSSAATRRRPSRASPDQRRGLHQLRASPSPTRRPPRRPGSCSAGCKARRRLRRSPTRTRRRRTHAADRSARAPVHRGRVSCRWSTSAGAAATSRSRAGPSPAATACAGILLEGGVDWQSVRPDGTLEIDAHYTLETDAGELIEVRSQGLRKATA